MTATALPRLEEPVEQAAGPGLGSVCFITQNFSFGGMEVHTLSLMRALIERGYRIELIANRYFRYDDLVHGYGWHTHVRIIHTDLGGILYGDPSDRGRWRQVLKGLTSKVLVFPRGNYSYGHLLFLRECRRVFTKIVFIEHKPAYERPTTHSRKFGVVGGVGLWWLKRKLHSNLASRYADAIVAVSEEIRERLVTDLGYRPDRVQVVQNGVPWRDFARRPEQGSALRSRYDIPSHAFVFGMLGRLSHEKGIDVALRAVRLVADQCPDRAFSLVIAGEGQHTEAIKELAAQLGVQEYVKFIGFVSRPEDILSGFDAILFPSRVEGLPLGLLQGMAAGCVPIVTRIGGMPHAVNAPELGSVVAPEDPVELCDAMQRLLALDAISLSHMRQNVVRRVREHFDGGEANRRIIDLCQLPLEP